MNRILNQLINIFFPEICIICKVPTPNHLCDACSGELIATALHKPECVVTKNPTSIGNLSQETAQNLAIDELYVTFNYKKSHVHKIIHAFKYQNIRSLATPLAQILYQTLPDIPDPASTLLIPIPIDTKRRKLRGYNQSQLLAKELSNLSGIPFQESLQKTRHTTSQMTLTRQERLTNLKDSFKISTQIPGSVEKIILIDDVTTTLSTLNEAALELTKHTNARIIGVVIAHNEDTSQAEELLI